MVENKPLKLLGVAMDSQDKVWETIYGVARQVATRANRIHRGIVPLMMCTNTYPCGH